MTREIFTKVIVNPSRWEDELSMRFSSFDLNGILLKLPDQLETYSIRKYIIENCAWTTVVVVKTHYCAHFAKVYNGKLQSNSELMRWKFHNVAKKNCSIIFSNIIMIMMSRIKMFIDPK